MYRLACILLHDVDESKDIVHDVFARILAQQVELKEDTAQSYLLLSVRNQCMNVIRNRKIHQQVHHYLLLTDELEQASPEKLEREIEVLRTGINKLFPPICQEVIRLHFTDSLPFREIAKRLGVSETTIYKHLRNALDQLRQTLKNAEQ
ncbi:MAG: sigma-70 family RNA polymerase sigma factor [Muribaculaceae bacterium]|nr:sigma-70 family RNA polymerase sigma factor [Muribaculaceae bacterium]